MKAFRPVAFVLLLASAGANLALARARAREATAHATLAADAAGGSSHGAPPRGARVARAEAARCGPEVAAMQAELERKEEGLRAIGPPHVLFARGTPNPAAEQRLAAGVAAALAAFKADRHHRLECRAHACQLFFFEPAAAGPEDWVTALAREARLRGLIGRRELGEAVRIQDPKTGESVTQRTIYFALVAQEGR